MVRSAIFDIFASFDEIKDKLTVRDLSCMDGTRWRDEKGVVIEENVRLMAKRLHAHGFIANIEQLLRVSVGGHIIVGKMTLTRLAGVDVCGVYRVGGAAE